MMIATVKKALEAVADVKNVEAFSVLHRYNVWSLSSRLYGLKSEFARYIAEHKAEVLVLHCFQFVACYLVDIHTCLLYSAMQAKERLLMLVDTINCRLVSANDLKRIFDSRHTLKSLGKPVCYICSLPWMGNSFVHAFLCFALLAESS